jgi:L-alanine-DL-glutamate epimerase-like enolase superfamily enzyme
MAFTITGLTRNQVDVLVVTLERDGQTGHGEAVGIHYLKETAQSMANQIDAIRGIIEAGISREQLQYVLPKGGARSALDSALWDLDAKLTGRSAWEIAGIRSPKPLVTALTCGADEPAQMAAVASDYVGTKIIKLKLTGEQIDANRVRAVRAARPDVALTVDANQGFTPASLQQLLPILIDARVVMIEQPFPRESDHLLDALDCPIPIAADESVQGVADIPSLVGRFRVVNIKLDKCGGLTEGLEMARTAKQLGLQTWVGNTMGTSLAMAPAFVLGQVCDYVELDGPVFLSSDRPHAIEYRDGFASCPAALWGCAGAPLRSAHA